MPTEHVEGALPIGGGAVVQGGMENSGGGLARPPAPQTNPMTFNTPGNYLFGIPAGVASIVVHQRGGGGGGGVGAATLGGDGGGGGGYATYTLGAPLIVAGGIINVTVGAGGASAANGTSSKARSPVDPTIGVTSNGGHAPAGAGGTGGTNLLAAGTGLINPTIVTGTAGSVHATTTGGTGGAGGSGGGAGGAGGATGKAGSAGTAPGGGGGGGGSTAAPGGAGAHGEVIISW